MTPVEYATAEHTSMRARQGVLERAEHGLLSIGGGVQHMCLVEFSIVGWSSSAKTAG
jgi:hypothetical protein